MSMSGGWTSANGFSEQQKKQERNHLTELPLFIPLIELMAKQSKALSEMLAWEEP